MVNLNTTRGLRLITRPRRSFQITPLGRPIIENSSVCKGVRLVSPQKGVLELPNTQYRCQIIGCEKRKRRKTLPEPQIPCYIRDKKWKNKVWAWVDDQERLNTKERLVKCLLCDKVGKYGVIQQHSKQHFLPEYTCVDCNDSWHIKGQWQQHFKYQCPHCDHTAKGELNLKRHIKTLH